MINMLNEDGKPLLLVIKQHALSKFRILWSRLLTQSKNKNNEVPYKILVIFLHT